MSTNNTQLTSAIGYKTDRMIFSDPIPGSIPNSAIKYQRINISTLNEDGTTGELILPTTELFSFGVSENKDFNDPKKVNGYVLPLCLFNREGSTPEEKAWVDTFDAIVEKCKDHLIQNREELEQYELTRAELKKMNPLYYKREKGKVVTDKGPTLYAKLIQAKSKKGKDDEKGGETKILTSFYDENDNPLNPMDLLGKYCFVKAAVKIESLFIGSKISVQIKLYEATVRLMASSMKRLLPRPKGESRMMTAKPNPMAEVKTSTNEEDEADFNGSIHGGSDDETPVPKAEEPEPEVNEEEEEEEKEEKPKKTSPKKPRKVKKVTKKATK